MPSISSCPACHRDLTLPDLADGQQQLRCPLCDAQFDAERALADSVSFPPAALIVTAGESTERPISPQDAATERSADDGAVGPFDGLPAEADASPAGSGEGATDYESFGRQAAAMRVAPKGRRQASPFGVLGQFLGMAIGGVLGLAIGYYVLIWIGGPRADFLELRGKLPRWLVPAVRRHNAAGETAPLASTNDGGAERPAPTRGDLLNERKPEGEKQAMPPSAGRVDRLPAIDREAAPSESFAGRDLPGPKPLPADYRGPRGFKLRTASELDAVLDQAEHALRCPHCQAPGAIRLAAFTALSATPGAERPSAVAEEPRCDYCRGKPVVNLTTAAFEQVCELAEAVTFVQFEPDDPDRDRRREAAESILLAIGSQRDKSDIAGRLAGARLDDSQRPSNGIVLAGTVQRAQPEGELFAIQLLLLGSGKPVTVISRHSPTPPVARRDRLIVLGSIVDSPRDNLAGYAGDLPQVVWGGLPLKFAASPH